MTQDKNRFRKTYSFFREQPVYASGMGGGGGGGGTKDAEGAGGGGGVDSLKQSSIQSGAV